MRALIRAGFYVRRRRPGSHVIMRRDRPYAQTVVPDHKQLDPGTLDNILEGAGLSIDELRQLL